MKIREQTILEVIPGWRRLDDDAPLASRLVVDILTTRGRQLRRDTVCRGLGRGWGRGGGGGGEEGGGGGGGGGNGGGGGGGGGSPEPGHSLTPIPPPDEELGFQRHCFLWGS